MPNQPGPLTGMTVIECSTWVFGPLAGSMLGDLGANVVKVESPHAPDACRRLVKVAGIDCEMPDGTSALFDVLNRSKRSIAIDIKTPAGLALLKELIAGADIFLQNFRPGVFDRYGLSFEELHAAHPRLIYASASGYGLKGEEAQRPALDPVGQARSGMFWVGGAPHDPPNWIPQGYADVMGASMLAYGVVAAVAARERFGLGQRVEVSHLQASMWLQTVAVGVGLLRGMTDFPRFDRGGAANPLFNHYETADGEWLTLGIVDSERHWRPFCEVMGLDALLDDPRFSDAAARETHARDLVAILDATFAQADRADWERRLGADPDLIFDRVQRVGDLPQDPAVIANEYLLPIEHPSYGPIQMVRHPANLSETPAAIRGTAPALGQHTGEVLKEVLGKTDDDLAELAAAGAIG